MCNKDTTLFQQTSSQATKLGSNAENKNVEKLKCYRMMCLLLVNSFWINKIWIKMGGKKPLPLSVINVYRVIKHFTVNHVPRGIWEICQFPTPDLHLLRNGMLLQLHFCSSLHKLISKHFTSQSNKYVDIKGKHDNEKILMKVKGRSFHRNSKAGSPYCRGILLHDSAFTDRSCFYFEIIFHI